MHEKKKGAYFALGRNFGRGMACAQRAQTRRGPRRFQSSLAGMRAMPFHLPPVSVTTAPLLQVACAKSIAGRDKLPGGTGTTLKFRKYLSL